MNNRNGKRIRSMGGFTLVELMVAITVGLIVSLAITGSVLTMGRQFRVVGANVAAQGSAQIGLALIDEAGRSAGAGLYNGGQPLCPTLNAWRDGAVISDGAVFMPVRIADGGSAGASDTVVFTAASATGPLSGMPVMVNMTTATDAIVIGDTGGLVSGDVALAGAPGSGQPCTLFQVTAAPTVGTVCGGNSTSCRTLARTVTGTGYNAPAGTFATAPLYGFDSGSPGVAGPAVVNRIGADFRQQAFAVRCEALIQFNAFSDAPDCTQTPLSFSGGANALATDVVLMHAQYGVSVGAASDIVTEWVDADGIWAAPSVANAGRVKAVRVVMVVRSKEPDPTEVTAETCTNGGGVENTGPCSFDDADAPVIDLSDASVPTGRTWRNYRYRVHQAVVPLRNVIWSD